MEKKTITVEILGQECKIVANSPEEQQRIQKTTQLIQNEIKTMISKNNVSQVTALLYTALNLGDRLFREMESTANLREQIAENAEQLTKLEKELQKRQKPKAPNKGKGKKDDKSKEDDKEEPTEEALEEEIEALEEKKEEEPPDTSSLDEAVRELELALAKEEESQTRLPNFEE